ncbi:MAG: APC family permease [Gemmatimonadales bacterium]
MADQIQTSGPRQTLSITAGASFLIGIVVGIGIFRTPSLVAANTTSDLAFMAVWLVGGLIMLVGALCYAELGSAWPNAGGEYHFLRSAYGHRLGVLFAWSRGTVIQTGAIAAVAFVYGDYASRILPLGEFGSAIHALLGVVIITGVNLAGTRPSTRVQVALTVLAVTALGMVITAGFTVPPATASSAPSSGGAVGLAMVFVLLTYGGWNEVAYLSGEMRDVQRNMIRALGLGTAVVVVLYLVANYGYLRALGLEQLRSTDTVGAALIGRIAGDTGAMLFSLSVCVCALSTLNATVFTGARAYYALGRDVPLIRRLGIWDERGDKPANALLLQAAIAIGLVVFGAVTRSGFEAMVAYTAPVFWFFLLLVAGSVIIFRRRGVNLPYRMPLYPLPPLLFAAAAAWMIYSSVLYAGIGSLLGIAVVVAGIPLLPFTSQGEVGGAKSTPPTL